MALANYVKVCNKNVPGLLLLSFSPIADLDVVTVTAGEITALTMDTSKLFNEFDVDVDGGKLMMEGSGKGNYFQTNKIEARFSKLTKDLRIAKAALVDELACGLAAIISDGNSQAWLVGYSEGELSRRPIQQLEAAFDSGQKPSDEDAAAYILTLTQESGYDPLPFDATQSAAIIGGTATYIDYN